MIFSIQEVKSNLDNLDFSKYQCKVKLNESIGELIKGLTKEAASLTLEQLKKEKALRAPT